MRNLELLLFDMDGVLVDTTSLLQKSYVELAVYLNARRPTQKEIKEAMPMSPRNAIRYLFGNQGDEAAQRFYQYWKVHLEQASAFAGIRELMGELVARNVAIGTVTSRNNSDTLTLLTATGLSGYMRTVVTWGRYRIAKPSPACLLVALADARIPANRTAYVGDQAIDMHAAKNADVLAVGAVWDSYANKEELEVAGADVIVERPREIVELLKDVW